jgi:polar amino acid transport system substrate-binding protein
MRYVLLAGISLLLAACGGVRPTAQGDVLERVKASGQVRIGVKADSPPFGVERGGVHVGFDIEIAESIVRRLGLDPVFVNVTSADRIPRILAGEVDMVVASMTQTRGRERQVDFTIPYFEDGPAILVKTASGLTSYLQLSGKRLGVAKGSSTAAAVGKVAPEAELVEVPAIKDLLPALEAGTVDAVASDYLILIGLARASGKGKAYTIAGGRIVSEPYGIALAPNQSAWRDALNETLMAMWEDGEWSRIAETWFGPQGRMPATIKFSMPTIPE